MVGAAYAAVPFYNWFCRATGFDGTTQVATSAPADVLDRKIQVRFDANVTGDLPWRFEPEQTSIEARIGEVVTVDYTVVNEFGARDRRRRPPTMSRRRPSGPISPRSTASASPSSGSSRARRAT